MRRYAPGPGAARINHNQINHNQRSNTMSNNVTAELFTTLPDSPYLRGPANIYKLSEPAQVDSFAVMIAILAGVPTGNPADLLPGDKTEYVMVVQAPEQTGVFLTTAAGAIFQPAGLDNLAEQLDLGATPTDAEALALVGITIA